MKQCKVTAKIPAELLETLQAESRRSGIGLQKLAGGILIHGLNSLLKLREERLKNEESTSE